VLRDNYLAHWGHDLNLLGSTSSDVIGHVTTTFLLKQMIMMMTI